jgi:hypothetical protein
MDVVKLPGRSLRAAERQRTDYRVGLSAWTDKSMLKETEFYPYKTPADAHARRDRLLMHVQPTAALKLSLHRSPPRSRVDRRLEEPRW